MKVQEFRVWGGFVLRTSGSRVLFETSPYQKFPKPLFFLGRMECTCWTIGFCSLPRNLRALHRGSGWGLY